MHALFMCSSCLALTDGTVVAMLPPAQDHKPLGDGGVGPNTGGMGACAPCPFVSPDVLDEIRRTIVQPVIDGMRAEGIMCAAQPLTALLLRLGVIPSRMLRDTCVMRPRLPAFAFLWRCGCFFIGVVSGADLAPVPCSVNISVYKPSSVCFALPICSR